MKAPYTNLGFQTLRKKGLHIGIRWFGGILLMLFVSTEIIEALWLKGAKEEFLNTYYLSKGVFIALATIVGVGWMVIKISRPILLAREWRKSVKPDKKTRLKNFILWFIFMRWCVVFLAGMLVYLTIWVYEWLPKDVWWPLVLTLCGIMVYNSICWISAHQGTYNSILLPLQGYIDLILLTVLLHFSGGIENFLVFLYVINIVIAGIILDRKHLWGITGAAITLLFLMAGLEFSGMLNHYTLSVFPHFEEHNSTIHAAQTALYTGSITSLLVVIILLNAFFIDTIMSRIHADETQLELFADQMQEQHQLIEKSLESTKMGLLVCNEKGTPLWANNIWKTWFGEKSIEYTANGAIAGNAILGEATLKDGKIQNREIQLVPEHSGDKSSIFKITTAPLRDKKGNINRFVALAMDITRQKETQNQMLRAGKLAAVGELAGKVAHEVNNPISIIGAKSRLLLSRRKNEMSPKVGRELEKITEAADRVSHIAKGLLSYGRPSVASRTHINLRIPVQNALSMIEQTAQKNGIEIDNRLTTSLPEVEANEEELQQIFLNLFLNSLDAMPDGGTLIIDTQHDGSHSSPKNKDDYLKVSVTDTGKGIPTDQQYKIFEPFFTTKESDKGTGLGLSICKGILKSYGGNIEVESQVGKGATFIISLLQAKD